jgi:hypothetical protein
MKSSRDKYPVDIEKRSDTTTIRVRNVNQEDFDEAYTYVQSLFNRASILEKRFQAEKVICTLWHATESGNMLSDVVTQSSHRVALSLFRVYPDSKPATDVVRETSLPRATVHDQLTGRRESVSQFFEKTENEYRLTKEGFDWVLNEVIPFVSSQTGKME